MSFYRLGIDDPAHPFNLVDQDDLGRDKIREQFAGLTLRQHITIEMMKANRIGKPNASPQNVAVAARDDTDALIDLLKRENYTP